jgi:hypothetical protein
VFRAKRNIADNGTMAKNLEIEIVPGKRTLKDNAGSLLAARDPGIEQEGAGQYATATLAALVLRMV